MSIKNLISSSRSRGATTFDPEEALGVSRIIYNADRGLFGCKRKVRSEGQGPVFGESLANLAYDYCGLVLEYFWQVHGRNSIDNEAMDIVACVEYGPDYGDAFWDFNDMRMMFGPGDGEIYDHFVRLDVTAHEFTHAITRNDCPLGRMNQPGAIYEHLGDVFGQLVIQWADNISVAEADWLSGKGLLVEFPDKAMRNMLNPGDCYEHPIIGKDVQVSHMKDYVTTTWDMGGVHINAGILNRAFALFAIGAGGYAWTKAGEIWYATFELLEKDTDFEAFARITRKITARRHPYLVGSLVSAWKAVGIDISI